MTNELIKGSLYKVVTPSVTNYYVNQYHLYKKNTLGSTHIETGKHEILTVILLDDQFHVCDFTLNYKTFKSHEEAEKWASAPDKNRLSPMVLVAARDKVGLMYYKYLSLLT